MAAGNAKEEAEKALSLFPSFVLFFLLSVGLGGWLVWGFGVVVFKSSTGLCSRGLLRCRAFPSSIPSKDLTEARKPCFVINRAGEGKLNQHWLLCLASHGFLKPFQRPELPFFRCKRFFFLPLETCK